MSKYCIECKHKLCGSDDKQEYPNVVLFCLNMKCKRHGLGTKVYLTRSTIKNGEDKWQVLNI